MLSISSASSSRARYLWSGIPQTLRTRCEPMCACISRRRSGQKRRHATYRASRVSLPIAGLFHGQQLNVTSLARDAGVARTTVQGYLEILEDTLFTFQIPALETRLRVRERRRPKLYWVDPGLVRTVIGPRREEPAATRGMRFEGWIAQLLRAYGDYRSLYDELVYWSPAGAKTEVDFVLVRGKEKVAIEVKAAERFRGEHTTGLRAISDLPGLTRRIVVYLGQRELRPEPGIEVLPLARFLEELQRGF